MEALSAVILVSAYHPPAKEEAAFYVLATVLPLLIPHMVLTVYICYVLAKKAGFTECLIRKLKTLKRLVNRYTVQTEADVEATSNTGSLPDRLINPGEYEPLLSTGNEHTAADTTVNEEPVGEEPRQLTPVYTYGSIN